jgi:hypothetical protein
MTQAGISSARNLFTDEALARAEFRPLQLYDVNLACHVINPRSPVQGVSLDAVMDTYALPMREQTAHIRVDSSFAAQAPLARYPDIMRCILPVSGYKKDGAPFQSGQDRIRNFEKIVVSAATDSATNLYAGYVDYRGKATFIFYSSDSRSLIKRLKTSGKLRHVPALTCEADRDTDWSYYFNVLYPPPIIEAQLFNARLLAGLHRQGDDGADIRAISHAAHFPTKLARDAFSRYLKKERYRVDHLPENADEHGAWSVSFVHRDAPVLLHMSVYFIAKEARKLKGHYDGWYCPVVAGHGVPSSSDEAHNSNENEKVRENLRKAGDDGTATRDIDHYAYFKTQLAARAFARLMAEQQYAIVRTSESAEENGAWLVLFQKPAKPVELDSETWSLQQQVERLFGSYDGWECAVVKGNK